MDVSLDINCMAICINSHDTLSFVTTFNGNMAVIVEIDLCGEVYSVL